MNNIIIIQSHGNKKASQFMEIKEIQKDERFKDWLIITSHHNGYNEYDFTDNDILGLGYNYHYYNGTLEKGYREGRFGSVWLNPEYALLYLSQKLDYDYIWHIEYDVKFNGKWIDFFEKFENCNADFITTYFNKATPDWIWYNLNNLEVDKYGSFNVIKRLSKRAIEKLDEKYKAGIYSNGELLIASILKNEEMEIIDINDIYKCYSNETMNCNKITKPGIYNYLEHPIE